MAEARKQYQVIAPMVFVRAGDQIHNLFAGQPVPSGVRDDELKRLEDEGFISSGAADGGVVVPGARKI